MASTLAFFESFETAAAKMISDLVLVESHYRAIDPASTSPVRWKTE